MLSYTQLNIPYRIEYYLNRDSDEKDHKTNKYSTVKYIQRDENSQRFIVNEGTKEQTTQHNTIQYNTKKQPVRRKKKKKKRDDHNTIRFKRNVALVSQSVKQSSAAVATKRKY